MSYQLKIFGKLTDIIEEKDLILDEIKDTDALQKELFKKYPVLADMKFFISVNNKLIKENTLIGDNAVIALMPPYSGG